MPRVNKRKTGKKKRSRSVRGKASEVAAAVLDTAGFVERLNAAHAEIDPREPDTAFRVAWVTVDDWCGHRDRLGFSALLALEEAVCSRLKSLLRPGDAVAGFGGGAFALLLGGDDRGRQWADALVRSVAAELLQAGKHTVSATVSAALANPDRDDDRPDQALLTAAEIAEELSARGGDQAAVRELARQPSSDPDRDLLRLLVDAIRDDTLRVVYQPLLGVGESSAVHYQMLPRLAGRDGELIPAARFVPLAAQQGVLSTLDRWMLSRALRSLSVYDNPEILARLFVIQSPALIDEPKFTKWLVRQLDTSPELARRLVIEFPVTELQPRLKAGLPILESLREQGVGICVGGVEDGVPEQLLLEHLPADYLRMATGFVRKLLADDSEEDRFRQFAARARAAGRRVIIPMLEDAESVTRVWRMDVDLIQGNFIQEPREAPDS